ncbi:programmed cell death protein 2 [Whalleya microplaca]|nr:programmed cell death protein 2 [Whalleya microplaca]
MAPYDSESSDGEEDGFTETNVLLGYASKEPGDDDNTSRLGGRPEWLDPSQPPSASLARCKICKDLMVLLLQLNAELPDRFPGHERRLYVFSCKKKSCRRRDGSIRALRSVRVAPGSDVPNSSTREKKKEEGDKPQPKEAPKPPSNLGETLFGAKTMGSSLGSANPFSTSTSTSSAPNNPFASPGNPFASPPPPSTSAAKTNPDPPTSPSPAPAKTTEEALTNLPQTFASALSLNLATTDSSTSTPATTPPSPWPPSPDQPTPYPTSYLWDAAYETFDPRSPSPLPASTRLDLSSSPPPGGGGGGREEREVFESTMDQTFQRFADRLAQNPEQAIRYEFGGEPLLYSRTDDVGQLLNPGRAGGLGGVHSLGSATWMRCCVNCGAARVFEVQLVPQAIAELEAEEEGTGLEGMDWGTVIVGVCEKDCQKRGVGEGQVGYLEEWVGVQWEELGGGGSRR